MKTLLLSTALLMTPFAASASIVNLELTGSWEASDFDVTPTGSNPSGDDDLVFGIAPSDGSVTVGLQVDTNAVEVFLTGDFGVTHDWYGYSTVSLTDDVILGDAFWSQSTTPVNLNGPNGSNALLWTNTDLSVADPTLVSFRMFGSWTNGSDTGTADMFFGSRTATTIGEQFLTWEYFAGEEIRSNDYSASVSAVPLPASVLLLFAGLGALFGQRKLSA